MTERDGHKCLICTTATGPRMPSPKRQDNVDVGFPLSRRPRVGHSRHRKLNGAESPRCRQAAQGRREVAKDTLLKIEAGGAFKRSSEKRLLGRSFDRSRTAARATNRRAREALNRFLLRRHGKTRALKLRLKEMSATIEGTSRGARAHGLGVANRVRRALSKASAPLVRERSARRQKKKPSPSGPEPAEG